MTTPDNLRDFSSIESGSVSSGPAPTTSSGASAATTSGPGLAAEFLSATNEHVQAMKTAASKVDNETFKNAVESHASAIKVQAALIASMD